MLGVQSVEVGRCLHPTEIHEQLDPLLSKAVDVHGSNEMVQQLKPPPGTLQIGTFGEHGVLRLHRWGAAHRAALRWVWWRRAIASLGHVRSRREHLGDHVAGPQHDHVLVLADVLALKVLLVVERRQLDRDAAHVNRLEHRVRMQVPELPRVPADLL